MANGETCEGDRCAVNAPLNGNVFSDWAGDLGSREGGRRGWDWVYNRGAITRLDSTKIRPSAAAAIRLVSRNSFLHPHPLCRPLQGWAEPLVPFDWGWRQESKTLCPKS